MPGSTRTQRDKRRIESAAAMLAVLALVLAFATPAGSEDGDFEEAIAAFHAVCLASANGFIDAQGIVEGLGYTIYPAAEDEFEFGSADGAIQGYVSANPDYPGCTVMAESLGKAQAADLAAELLIDTFGVTLEPWDYDGQQAGWRMPQDQGVLYIVFNDGGLSAETRDE